MWNSGSTSSTTSSSPIGVGSRARHCSRFASSARWLSIAARGRPLVPEVNISTARSSPPRSAGRRGRAAPGRGHRVQAGRVHVHPVAAGDGLLHHGEGGVVAEHDLDVGLGEQPRDLRRGVAGVDRHRHQTGPQHREVRRDEGRRVRHREGDPVAGVQAERGAQAGRGGVDVGVECRPGRACVRDDRASGRCTRATPPGRRAAAARTRSATLAHRRSLAQRYSLGCGPWLRLRRSRDATRRTATAEAVVAGRGVGGRGRGRGRAAGAAGPARGGVLRRRQHGHAGRVDLPPGPRPVPRDFFTARDIGRFAWQQAKFRVVGREDLDNVHEARETALSFAAGHTVAELTAIGEEVFDEVMAAKVWPGTRALAQMHLDAGQRVWLVTATPVEVADGDRHAGSGSPARWAPSPRPRTASTPAGWSARSCTARRRPRRSRALAEREGLDLGRLLGVLRLRQRHPDAVPGRAPVRDQPGRRGCGRTPASTAGGSATTAPAARR